MVTQCATKRKNTIRRYVAQVKLKYQQQLKGTAMTNEREQISDQRQTILSSANSLKYFSKLLSESEIVDCLSDLKHRIFPRPFERLYEGELKENLVGIEIGVAGGEHSKSIFETLDVAKLYCIDPYTIYDDYNEGKLHFGVDQAPLDVTEIHAHKLLKNYSENIVWIKKLSSDAVTEIKEKVDFVYIDGNHAEKYVKEDIENYFPLVKKGGIIGGHDFYNGFQREHDGVVSAVIEFCTKKNIVPRIELPDWWIIKP
jgi:hypothetical protein